MQKAVFRVSLHDDRIKRKVFVTASGFPGVNSVAIDDKNEKMTVIGDIDVPKIVMKLRKICETRVDTVGPAKEPEKKPEPKKPEPPKPPIVPVPVMPVNHYAYYSQYPTYPNAKFVEAEDPNACVIC